jgi:hypothetical protein
MPASVDRDQVLHLAHLAGDDDALGGQADLLRHPRRIERRADHRLAHHLFGSQGGRCLCILIHQAREQLLIEAAPVHADAHRLAIADGALDHGGKLVVAFRAFADVARVDAVLGERLGAVRELGQQLMAVVMEVAHQGHAAADRVQAGADARHLRRSLRRVDGDAHQLRTGARQLLHLLGGRLRVGSVGIGHRLHHHRRAAADQHVLDRDLAGSPAH